MKPLPTLLPLALALAALSGCGGGREGTSANVGASVGASAAVVRSHATASRSQAALAASASHTAPGASASKMSSIPHYPGVPRYPGDSDGDNDRNSDENMRTPGREGLPAERRAIAAAIERYYAIALADDGEAACSMLTASLARSVPLEYGRYGTSYLHGKTCAEVVSKLFKHQRRQVVAVAATQKLIDVRLEGDHGYAALHVDEPCLRGSCALNMRILKIANVLVKREGDTWKIDSLLAIV